MPETQSFSPERSWMLDQIACILFDLADAEDSGSDPAELLDQLKTVAEIILDGLNARIISHDGTTILLTVGENPE
jgi:hypothetical protein